MLVVDQRGTCDDGQTLSDFYFRETRHLRTLRLTLNGEEPWLCEAAVDDPTTLRFDYVHPEMHSFGGGGSGGGHSVEPRDAKWPPLQGAEAVSKLW